MVTLNLSHCTASNNAGSVEKGGAYTNKLTADNGYAFTNPNLLGGFDVGGSPSAPETGGGETPVSDIALFCQVAMGDENVTTQVFDIATGEIEIDEVTGPLVIRTWSERS